jgi:hypothetical protein
VAAWAPRLGRRREGYDSVEGGIRLEDEDREIIGSVGSADSGWKRTLQQLREADEAHDLAVAKPNEHVPIGEAWVTVVLVEHAVHDLMGPEDLLAAD